MKSKIASYNQEVQILLNERIKSVQYCEIDFGEPFYDFGEYHSVDHGIQFEMFSGKDFYFIWSTQYQNYDLKFGRGSILTQFPSNYPPPLRTLSNHSKWHSFIGKRITNIRSYWPYVKYRNNSAKIRYPQDLKLEFDNNQALIISAIEIDNNNTVVPMADNITIFFDIKTAEKYDLCKDRI